MFCVGWYMSFNAKNLLKKQKLYVKQKEEEA